MPSTSTILTLVDTKIRLCEGLLATLLFLVPVAANMLILHSHPPWVFMACNGNTFICMLRKIFIIMRVGRRRCWGVSCGVGEAM